MTGDLRAEQLPPSAHDLALLHFPVVISMGYSVHLDWGVVQSRFRDVEWAGFGPIAVLTVALQGSLQAQCFLISFRDPQSQGHDSILRFDHNVLLVGCCQFDLPQHPGGSECEHQSWVAHWNFCGLVLLEPVSFHPAILTHFHGLLRRPPCPLQRPRCLDESTLQLVGPAFATLDQHVLVLGQIGYARFVLG